MKCKDCKHWKQQTYYLYDGAVNDGVCNELPNSKFIVNIYAGWEGGGVSSIETDEDFGCTSFIKKE